MRKFRFTNSTENGVKKKRSQLVIRNTFWTSVSHISIALKEDVHRLPKKIALADQEKSRQNSVKTWNS